MDSIMNFLISNANAADIPGAPMASQGGGFSFLLMFLILVFFIYFAVWRPQNKRAKEQQQMWKALAKGDEVVTAGGLMGRVNKIVDPYIVLSVTDNVEVVMQKSSIANVLPKGTLKSIES